MENFRILRDAASSFMRYTTDVVDSRLIDDVADVVVSRSKGMTNPLHVLSFGELSGGIFRPSIYEHTADRVLRAGGDNALNDAIRGLSSLGDRYGVDGIHIGSDPNYSGLIKFAGENAYVGGSPVTNTIGKAAAMEIDAAARRVLDFVDAPR